MGHGWPQKISTSEWLWAFLLTMKFCSILEVPNVIQKRNSLAVTNDIMIKKTPALCHRSYRCNVVCVPLGCANGTRWWTEETNMSWFFFWGLFALHDGMSPTLLISVSISEWHSYLYRVCELRNWLLNYECPCLFLIIKSKWIWIWCWSPSELLHLSSPCQFCFVLNEK